MNFSLNLDNKAYKKKPTLSVINAVASKTSRLLDYAIMLVIIFHLIRPFKKWDAYKLGLIDENGNEKKKPTKEEEFIAWSPLKKFLARIKKLLTGKMVMSLLTFYTLMKESNEEVPITKEAIMESRGRKEKMDEVHKKVMDTLVSCNVSQEEYHTFLVQKLLEDTEKIEVYVESEDKEENINNIK